MTEFVVADSGIRQLHARFADAVWRQDYGLFGDCFAEDGVWKITGQRFAGRAAIAAAGERLLGRCERIQLVLGMPIPAVGDGIARGRLQVTELTKKKDGTGAMTLGTYHDRYVEAGGAWRFQSRHWSMAYHGPVDMSAAYVPQPDYGAFPAAPGDDEPTYVRRA